MGPLIWELRSCKLHGTAKSKNKSVNLEKWAAVEEGIRDLVCRMFSVEVNKACFYLAKGPIPQRWESVEEPNLEQLLIRLEEEQQR